jgi:hypothetical protein
VNGHKSFEEMTPQEKLERLVQLVINLDAGVDKLGAFYVTMNKEVENTANVQRLSNQMLEHKVNLIRRTLGSKSEHLKSEIEAPTVWGAMAAVCKRTEGVNNVEPIDLPAERQDKTNTAEPPVSRKRLASFETDLLVMASTLSKAIQSQGHRIDALQGTSTRIP